MASSATGSDSGEATGVRDRLLAAAVSVLREEGFAALTQVRVAETAGVRQSHLTYYFPKRLDLVAAVVARVVEGMVCAVRAGLDEDTADDVRVVLQRLTREIADTAHMRMFIGAIVAADSDAELRSILVDETRRMEARLADALRIGREAVRSVLAVLWGIGLYAFVVRTETTSDPAALLPGWFSGAAALMPAWLSVPSTDRATPARKG